MELVNDPLHLEWEDFFSTFEQSTPSNQDTSGTKTIIEKKR